MSQAKWLTVATTFLLVCGIGLAQTAKPVPNPLISPQADSPLPVAQTGQVVAPQPGPVVPSVPDPLVRADDPLGTLVAKLRKPVQLGESGEEIGLRELANKVSDVLDIPVLVLLDRPSRTASDSREARPDDPARGTEAGASEVQVTLLDCRLPLGQALQRMLAPHRLTYLLHSHYFEILPLRVAAQRTQTELTEDGQQLVVPLVSAVVLPMRASRAVTALGEEFDMTVVVAPQVGTKADKVVAARLLNVPFDRALRLLATQADLEVAQTGNAFVVTDYDRAIRITSTPVAIAQQEAKIRRLLTPWPPFATPVPAVSTPTTSAVPPVPAAENP